MKAFPVTLLCKVMEVSRSGFYQYLDNLKNKNDDPFETALKDRIKQIFKEHFGRYGSRRILKQLAAEGNQIGRYKVRRLMKNLDLKARFPKPYKVTTNSKHNFNVAPNVLERKFNVERPNSVWTADITYNWTLEGWSYLWPLLWICIPVRSLAGPSTRVWQSNWLWMLWPWPTGEENLRKDFFTIRIGEANMLAMNIRNCSKLLVWNQAWAEKVTAGIMLQQNDSFEALNLREYLIIVLSIEEQPGLR